MTELEQKLLDELEALEREREEEAERLKSLAENYKQSIEQVSNSLTVEYQSKLKELIQSDSNSNDSLIAYLQTLTEQNNRIIKLLEKPPKAEDTVEKLKPILSEFFNTLERNLTASNKELIEQIETSLKEL